MIFDCGSQSFYKLKCTFFRRTGLYGEKDRGYLNQNGTKRSPLFDYVGGLIALQLWSDLLALALLSLQIMAYISTSYQYIGMNVVIFR